MFVLPRPTNFGMKGICVKGGPEPTTWDVEHLAGIVPLLSAWIGT